MLPESEERLFDALKHLDDCIDALKTNVNGLRVDYATHNAATSVRLKHLEGRMDRREDAAEQTGTHALVDVKADARDARESVRWNVTTWIAIGFGLVSTGFAFASLFHH